METGETAGLALLTDCKMHIHEDTSAVILYWWYLLSESLQWCWSHPYTHCPLNPEPGSAVNHDVTEIQTPEHT